MDPVELRPGLYRWTAAHPDWRDGATKDSPADWPEMVGCVAYLAPDAVLLIDPLVPAEEPAAFWSWLDALAAERDRVAVMTTIAFHRRSRDEIAARYGATTSRARSSLPTGVRPLPIRGAGETMAWIEEHRALVPGDRLLGAAGGGLRVCPDSWLGYLGGHISPAELRERLRGLLELPVEIVVVSHGEPLLEGGHAAIAAALSPPP